MITIVNGFCGTKKYTHRGEEEVAETVMFLYKMAYLCYIISVQKLNSSTVLAPQMLRINSLGSHQIKRLPFMEAFLVLIQLCRFFIKWLVYAIL